MLQDVIHAPPQAPPQEAEELTIHDEISSPISARIFELCDPDLFPENLQDSEVTSSSNCCYEDNSSYAQNISLASDVDNKFNTCNTITTQTSTNPATRTTAPADPTATITTNNNNTTNSSNLSIVFDPQDEIDNDISASIDFSSSPAFSVPQYLPVTTQQDQQFDFSSLQPQVTLAASSVVDGLAQYPPDSTVAPLMGAPLAAVFEDDCLTSVPSYVPLNPSPPSCSYLSPGMGPYMPLGPLNTAMSADGSGIYGSTIILGSDLQPQELDYQGENGGLFGPDSIQRAFNTPDLQAFSAENQQLLSGAASSTTLTPEISNLEDNSYKVRKLSVEQRQEKIGRYLKKRQERNFSKKIKYACRKTLADSRPRVRGRFAKNDDFGDTHRPASSNHEEDDEDDIVVKEEDDDMVDSSDIFAHISGVNSFKCNYSIQSWI